MKSVHAGRIKSTAGLVRQSQQRVYSSQQCVFQRDPIVPLLSQSNKQCILKATPKHKYLLSKQQVIRSAHGDTRNRRQSRPRRPEKNETKEPEKELQESDLNEGENLYVNPVSGYKDRFTSAPAWTQLVQQEGGRIDSDLQARLRDERNTREIMSPIWMDHEQEIVLRKPPKKTPVAFTPEVFTAESLITNRIATASSTTASNQATVQAAMAKISKRDDVSFSFDADLARQVAHGKIVRFKDADEKARILALAEEHAMETTRKRNVRKLLKSKNGESMEFESPLAVEFEGIPEKHKKALVDSVLRGRYDYEGKTKNSIANPALSGLKKVLDFNGTYHASSSGGFLGLFKRLFPQTSKR